MTDRQQEGETVTNSTQPEATDFDVLYRTYRLYVYDLCRKRFQREEDALDLAAIVWAEIAQVRQRMAIEEPRKLLAQLVSWRAKDLYRQQYRGQSHKVEWLAEDQQLHALLEQHSTRRDPDQSIALQQAMLSETEEDRRLLFGRFVEGLTWEELSSRHALHRNTLLKRVKSSLLRLKRILEPQVHEGTAAHRAQRPTEHTA